MTDPAPGIAMTRNPGAYVGRSGLWSDGGTPTAPNTGGTASTANAGTSIAGSAEPRRHASRPPLARLTIPSPTSVAPLSSSRRSGAVSTRRRPTFPRVFRRELGDAGLDHSVRPSTESVHLKAPAHIVCTRDESGGRYSVLVGAKAGRPQASRGTGGRGGTGTPSTAAGGATTAAPSAGGTKSGVSLLPGWGQFDGIIERMTVTVRQLPAAARPRPIRVAAAAALAAAAFTSGIGDLAKEAAAIAASRGASLHGDAAGDAAGGSSSPRGGVVAPESTVVGDGDGARRTPGSDDGDDDDSGREDASVSSSAAGDGIEPGEALPTDDDTEGTDDDGAWILAVGAAPLAPHLPAEPTSHWYRSWTGVGSFGGVAAPTGGAAETEGAGAPSLRPKRSACGALPALTATSVRSVADVVAAMPQVLPVGVKSFGPTALLPGAALDGDETETAPSFAARDRTPSRHGVGQWGAASARVRAESLQGTPVGRVAGAGSGAGAGAGAGAGGGVRGASSYGSLRQLGAGGATTPGVVAGSVVSEEEYSHTPAVGGDVPFSSFSAPLRVGDKLTVQLRAGAVHTVELLRNGILLDTQQVRWRGFLYPCFVASRGVALDIEVDATNVNNDDVFDHINQLYEWSFDRSAGKRIETANIRGSSARRLLARIDANGDHLISREELWLFLATVKPLRLRWSEFKSVFEASESLTDVLDHFGVTARDLDRGGQAMGFHWTGALLNLALWVAAPLALPWLVWSRVRHIKRVATSGALPDALPWDNISRSFDELVLPLYDANHPDALHAMHVDVPTLLDLRGPARQMLWAYDQDAPQSLVQLVYGYWDGWTYRVAARLRTRLRYYPLVFMFLLVVLSGSSPKNGALEVCAATLILAIAMESLSVGFGRQEARVGYMKLRAAMFKLVSAGGASAVYRFFLAWRRPMGGVMPRGLQAASTADGLDVARIVFRQLRDRHRLHDITMRSALQQRLASSRKLLESGRDIISRIAREHHPQNTGTYWSKYRFMKLAGVRRPTLVATDTLNATSVSVKTFITPRRPRARRQRSACANGLCPCWFWVRPLIRRGGSISAAPEGTPSCCGVRAAWQRDCLRLFFLVFGCLLHGFCPFVYSLVTEDSTIDVDTPFISNEVDHIIIGLCSTTFAFLFFNRVTSCEQEMAHVRRSFARLSRMTALDDGSGARGGKPLPQFHLTSRTDVKTWVAVRDMLLTAGRWSRPEKRHTWFILQSFLGLALLVDLSLVMYLVTSLLLGWWKWSALNVLVVVDICLLGVVIGLAVWFCAGVNEERQHQLSLLEARRQESFLHSSDEASRSSLDASELLQQLVQSFQRTEANHELKLFGFSLQRRWVLSMLIVHAYLLYLGLNKLMSLDVPF